VVDGEVPMCAILSGAEIFKRDTNFSTTTFDACLQSRISAIAETNCGGESTFFYFGHPEILTATNDWQSKGTFYLSTRVRAMRHDCLFISFFLFFFLSSDRQIRFIKLNAFPHV